MIDRREIGSGIRFSDAAIVLSEGDIQHPMQAVFYLPVVADASRYLLWAINE